MDWTSILVATIAALAPTIAVVKRSHETNYYIGDMKTDSDRARVRSEIMQLILEDRVAVMDGGVPANYKEVLHLYDYYKTHSWNSYIHRRVRDYTKWYDRVTCEENKR